MEEIKNVKLLISNMWYDSKRILLVLFLSTLYAVFDGISLGTIVPLIQSLESRESASSTLWIYLEQIFEWLNLPLNFVSLLMLIFIIFAFRQVTGHFRKKYQYRIAYDFIVKLRKGVFENVIRTDMEYFNKTKIGNLVNSLIIETNQAGSGFIIIIELLNTILVLSIYGLLLLFISWEMTLIAGAVIIVVSLFLNKRVRRSKNYKEKIIELNNKLNASTVEAFSGFRLIKAAVTENKEIKKLHTIAQRNSTQQHKFDMNGVDMYLIFEFVIFSTILLILFISVEMLKMPLASLLVFMVVMVRMVPYAQSINNHRHLIAGYAASLQNVLDNIQKASRSRSITNGTENFTELKNSIQIKDLSFSYDGSEKVLKELNFTVAKGEYIAIVGASGGGKSTLIDLILRFYDPVKGEILIDGTNLKDLDISDFRRSIGIVSQDTFLFNDTVAANIAYGSDATKEEIIDSAKTAHAHGFIEQLPEKYDTILGDRGVRLSGGQKQRLALARAIIKHPQLLILDEATSALDTESEKLIKASLQQLGKKYTIIAIAHRLSTVENADKIIVLESGKIIEEGKHAELLTKNGSYAKYYRMQFDSDD